MGAPLKPQKDILPPDSIEREKINQAGRSAAASGMPIICNPYRDADRREAWEAGFNNSLGIKSHT